MGFGEALDDGQPQSGALIGDGDVVAGAAEALEHLQLVFRRDADAVVLDRQNEPAVGLACASIP